MSATNSDEYIDEVTRQDNTSTWTRNEVTSTWTIQYMEHLCDQTILVHGRDT
jgi:hypothetical protein